MTAGLWLECVYCDEVWNGILFFFSSVESFYIQMWCSNPS